MEIQPILHRLGEARQVGAARVSSNSVDMERRQGAQYIADLSMRLSSEVVAVLSEATQIRESGLAAARSSDLRRAQSEIDDARRCIERAGNLPYEAQLCARTFQSAAVAYLAFVQGRMHEAKEELDRSLETNVELSYRFGYSNEVRRIHLCRNIVRVLAESDRFGEAWSLCCCLLRYIWDPHSPWPYCVGRAPGETSRTLLRRQERLFISDQVLAELVQLVTGWDRRLSARMDDLQAVAELSSETPLVSRVVSLCIGLARGGPDPAVLTGLCDAIEEGSAGFPQTWGKLNRFAEQLVNNYDSIASRFPARAEISIRL